VFSGAAALVERARTSSAQRALPSRSCASCSHAGSRGSAEPTKASGARPGLTKPGVVPRVHRAVRVVAAVILILLGCGAALMAWGPLQNLFGYRDSPVSTYLLFGLPWLLLAVAAFAVAWRMLTH
jgi:hypothetical protein